MVIARNQPQARKVASAPALKVTQPVVQPSPQEVFYPNRVVRFQGRIYSVKWCDGVNVCISARQSPYRGVYEYLPGMYTENEFTISVNHIFLSVV